MSDIKNILSQIKSLSDDVDVYLPSFGKSVKIKQLTVKQCKDLINMPQNILHAQYAFFRKFLNILKENAPDVVDDMNIVDRVSAIITLRAKALNKYNDIDLSEIVKQIPTISYDLVVPTVVTENYTFTLKIPTLKSEDIFNSYIIKTYKLNKENMQLEEMQLMSQEIFGELAIIELCKFISHINIHKKDIDIDMEKLSPTQRKEIIENIQLEEMKDVVEFNNKVHDVESNYTNFTIGDKNVQLDIGPDFFVFI